LTDGEAELSEDPDGSGFAALEITGGKTLTGSELVCRA
jgi:hypothetical protein